MQFNTIKYLVFLFIVFAVTLALSKLRNSRWIILLLASLIFYYTWQPYYVALLLFSAALVYSTGLLMGRSPDLKTRRRWLWAGGGVQLLILFFFKYTEPIISSITGLNPKSAEYPLFRILLPVGISFYTFQALSYLFDIYYGFRKEERHAGYFAAYLTSFPQLISGPIERSGNFLKQLRQPFVFNLQETALGTRRIVWGLFKKVVVADRIGAIVDPVYYDVTNYHGAILFFVSLLYVFQLYFDFSGYSDIAIGSAEVLGIKLGENFNHPLSSKSVTEFWRKWHISLGNWLRDYVYNPILFANKKWGKSAIYFALLVTFLICGIWHGAKWNYVIFGSLQAFALVVEAILARKRKQWANSKTRKVYLAISWVLTFTFIFISDIFFRSGTVEDATHIIQSFVSSNWRLEELLAYVNMLTKPKLAFSLMFLISLIIVDRRISQFAHGKKDFGQFGNALVSGSMMAMVIIFGYWGKVAFLYFQF